MATKTEEKSGADKVAAARNKNLDLAIQQIAKDYGEGAIMRLGAEKIVDIEVIPTGNILSSTRSILSTPRRLALIWTICLFLNQAPAKRRSVFAKH